MGFVATVAFVIAILGFVPLSTNRARLAGVGLIDFLKCYPLGGKFVFQVIHDLAKVPVG